MSTTYNLIGYENNTTTISNILSAFTGSKGQVFVGNGSRIEQLPAGATGQILTVNSSKNLGVDWTSFTGTTGTTYSQTIYGSADYRNGSQSYYYVWSFATSNSSQNNADWYSSPSNVNIVGFSIRPGYNYGWYDTVPTQGSITVSFGTTTINGQGQPPGQFSSLGVDLTINYTDIIPVSNRFRSFSVTGLNHIITPANKWSLEVSSINWSGGGGFVGRALVTVYLNSTFV